MQPEIYLNVQHQPVVIYDGNRAEEYSLAGKSYPEPSQWTLIGQGGGRTMGI